MFDQNKQLNKHQGVTNQNTDFSVSDVSVFKDNSQAAYFYKKTEKLVSAVYLLSSFISDREPLKWQLREAGVELLSQGINLSDRTAAKQIAIQFSFVTTGLKLLSFLEVAYISGIISEMNFNILKYEVSNLIQTVESEEKNNSTRSLVFPEHFFDVPETPNTQNFIAHSDKGHNTLSDRLSLKKSTQIARPSDLKQKDKSNRQEIIISLLKKNSELGIKDFTTSIKDCSEKTIQRELALLVSKGQIKKAGEKRWSRYSLK